MEFTVQNICGLLIRSKLLSPDEVKAMYQRWQNEAREKDAANLGLFSKWLVANRYVTEYQASLITRGHADDFFLNQYKILDRLGRGRMAGVYKAVHQLGQVVAIKVLPPSKAKDPRLLARFLREARLAMRLKHPNVVRSFQVGQANGLNYLVMEYLEGETLDDVLQRRRQLPPPEGVRLIHQALQGLQHIHEQGMVHRDLKPSNLMLVPGPSPGQPDTTARATVKILDIGLGRVFFDETSPAPPADGHDNMQLTAEGVLLGTPDYLSPEQARDPRNIDIRSDIYSLGCVLYHTLAGQPPFPDTNIISQMVRHATEAPRPVRELNPSVPDGLQQILNWMLAKDPAQRYPTPERAAQALQVFLVAGSEQPRALEAEPQMRKFLTWLETGNGEGPPTATPVGSSQPPAATPALAGVAPAAGPAKGPANPRPPAQPAPAKGDKAAPKPKPTAQTPVPPTRKQHGRKHKRRKSALHRAAQAAPALESQQFDVELVPITGPVMAQPAPAPGWKPNRRDWVMLGIGAGAAIVAGLFGILIRWLTQPDYDD
jgi:serine/threonine protein kinase